MHLWIVNNFSSFLKFHMKFEFTSMNKAISIPNRSIYLGRHVLYDGYLMLFANFLATQDNNSGKEK